MKLKTIKDIASFDKMINKRNSTMMEHYAFKTVNGIEATPVKDLTK